MELKFKVKKQIMRRYDKEEIVQKSKNLIKASFIFTEEWDNLEKFAVFKDSHNREYTAHLGRTCKETCIVPHQALRGKYFTVTVYAGNIITTNDVIVYLYYSAYENHMPRRDPFHRYYDEDIFVEIFEKIHNKIDDVTFADDSIQFWGDDELIQSISLPYADEALIEAWMAEINQIQNNANEAIEEIQSTLETKSDVGHTHSKADVVDFDNEVDENIDDFLSTLTEALNKT